MSGIPSARYIDHLGMTVPNLEDAVHFFVDFLGAEFLYTAGPYSDPGGTYLSTRLGVSDQGRVRLAQVRLGANLNIELVEMEAPDQRREWPKLSDHGAYHLAIHVDDFDSASNYLAGHPQIRLLEPHDNGPEGTGPEGGLRARYFSAPFGLHLEIIQRPPSQSYEAHTDARVFATDAPWPKAETPRPVGDLSESRFEAAADG